MKINEKFVCVLLILLLGSNILGPGVFSTSAPASVRSDPGVFRRSLSYDIVCDQLYFEKVSEAIDNAEKSIHVSMFLMVIGNTVEELVDKLVEARNRGVDVAILLDDDPEPNVDYTYSYLKDRGLNVKLDDTDKALHSKLLIIDNRTVIVGSTNWSDNSIDNNREANVRINDPDVADYYERFFWNAWEDASYDMELGRENHNGVVPLIDRDHLPALMSAITNATRRIYILLYAFKLTDFEDSPTDQLFDAIVDAHQRGVEVKVVLEKSDWEEYLNEMNQYTINKFTSYGVEAYSEEEERITHAKLIVVDDVVIVGSTNWAYGSLKQYHSANIMVHNVGLTSAMIEFYSDVWGVRPGERKIEIHTIIGSSRVAPGEEIQVGGYLTSEGARMPNVNVTYWIEDENGEVVVEQGEVVTDEKGNFYIGVEPVRDEGAFLLKLRVRSGAESAEKTVEITARDNESDGESGSSIVRIAVIISVFGLGGLLLFLMVLFKKDEE